MNRRSAPGFPSRPATRRAPSNPATGQKRNLWGRYARLSQLAGPSFLAIGFPARLPLAMLTIGTLTMVTASTGSYASGGFAAGAVGIGSAIGAPALGYFADRQGQRPVLLLAAAAHTLAIGMLLLAVYAAGGAGMGAILAASFAVGATSPQVSPLARVRWMAMTRDDKQVLDTALSYESTADELTFVLGPALVGLLAAAVAPWLPFVLAVLITATLVPAFALHRTSFAVVPVRRSLAQQHPEAAAEALRSRQPVNWLRTSVPVLGMIAMGTFFGGSQNALSAFGGTFGAADAAGLLYSLLGLTSAFGALSVAYWPARWKPAPRWIVCAGAMAAFSALLLLPGDVGTMVIVLLVIGLPVGPTMVTIFSIGTLVAPKDRLGTVMTLLASGVVLGSAIGSAAAGAAAERGGYADAFVVPIAAAAALFVLGFLAAAVARSSSPGDRGDA
ncbi:MFS transporter [Arthrobacter mangrovi]|uniref:MFS transporter n=1 Tax=Arthrobacter mangrovi TaxID=2966350 RepID=A0ABQ5MSP2_9MICC|nr:MFS transporter [Arthrobacter mangrovi]GLB66775.1 MFS transporter [Arthrobacter mangrovi]